MPPPPRRLPFSTPFVLRLAYEQADFKMVRTHWNKNFVRKFPPGEPVHFLMARVLHQIRTDGYVIRDHYVFPLEEVTTPGENTPDEQIYCALHQLDAVRFSFEMAALKQYYVHRLLDDTQERRIGCVEGLVTMLFNPELHNYLLNVAQLDEMLPASGPLS
ncbi:hypothetical protein MUN81_22335 (plasmid) [Hymenobacter sp. 5317J-9]|uniref:hypothetical protein n=1 Tax=Hymenobacter sp. 5317J-9 TaxID=2932250 RepID=UPI001FD70200|nr:hypothetical protein [Hymenobacter sp. 5317J-9]UOR00128.1 hypothetical protein MUN81_22335 [Hymenobacter sp. 5317J-9]